MASVLTATGSGQLSGGGGSSQAAFTITGSGSLSAPSGPPGTTAFGITLQGGTFTNPITMPNNGGIFWSNSGATLLLNAIGVNGSNILALGSDPNIPAVWIATASTGTQVFGPLVLSGLGAGTAAKYLCLTSGGAVIAQVAACP